MRLAALALAALLPVTAVADPIASLPLSDPPRGLDLVSAGPGDLLDLAGDRAGSERARTFDEMIADLASADVVILGEHHAHAEGHRQQARILDALAARREVALGMEFFESEDDEALARYVSGETTLDRMLEETAWSGFNFDMYRPLVDSQRARRAPVVGLNVPRSIVRTVSREGVAALTGAQRELVGDPGAIDPRHRYLVDMLTGGHGSALGPMFDGMVRGQMTWDAAMTRSVLRAREGVAKGRLVVVIVGMGHCAHGLGIPARLRAADPALKVKVACPTVAETPPKNAQVHPGMESVALASVSRGFADWALVLPDEKGVEPWPTFGVTMEEKDGGARIASVEAGGIASRAGIAAGDVLERVGETKVTSLASARRALSLVPWSERSEWTVRRGGASVVVPVLVVAATDGPGRWLESAPASSLLDAFDPESAQPVGEGKPLGSLPRARIVTLTDDAVRVDVLAGGRLAQSWILDDQRRPVLGLLAEPETDGAVRIEIDRGPAGEAAAVRRLDARNAIVAPASPAAAAK